jgi:hypothetical protein
MSAFLRPGSREDLEREVLRAVKRNGYCYTHDRLLTDQLHATSPEQVVAWQQSFCERSGLTGRPYQEETSSGVSSGPAGVIFEATPKGTPHE